jgi:hypothetical protein
MKNHMIHSKSEITEAPSHHQKGKSDFAHVLMGCVLVLAAAAVVWSIPRSSGDLFTALAGGRDVVSGKLASPDTWSFSTENRIRINQNWGADLIIYIIHELSGELGLLILKAAIIGACALFLMLSLRTAGRSWALSLAVSGIIICSINLYAILRPNLFSLCFVPLELFFLYESRKHPRYIWIAGLINIVWANTHGGFAFGLIMMGLWSACTIIPDLVVYKAKPLILRWEPAAALIVTILLCGIASPFGFTNIVFPFNMMGNGLWNTIRDWLPIWSPEIVTKFKTPIGFLFALVSITLSLSIIRIVVCMTDKKPAKRSEDPTRSGANESGIIAFEAIAAIVASIMAVVSNRFLPIGLLMLAPLFARQAAWLLDITRAKLILPLSCASMLVFVVFVARDVALKYDANNPLFFAGEGSLFDKMHYVNSTNDRELAGFIEANDIKGNILSPWDWEGYIRWMNPRLKVFIGGRAQQVYKEETFREFLFLSGVELEYFRGKTRVDVLRSIDPDLIAVRNIESFDIMTKTALGTGDWVIVFADEKSLLLANTASGRNSELIARCAEHVLVFESDTSRSLSDASYRVSRSAPGTEDATIEAFRRAFELSPSWLWGYIKLYGAFRNDPEAFKQSVELLDFELARLLKTDTDNTRGGSLLACRIFIGDTLGDLASKLDMPEKAEEERTIRDDAKATYSMLQKRWHPALLD